MAKLPDSVVKLLKSKRYIHLATSLNDKPHVSLMIYTYYSKGDQSYIIVSTPKDTTKFKNLSSNPNVSMLVHDWVASHDEPSGGEKRRNSLYELLANINKSEISSVSVMLNGEAKILEPQDENYEFLKSVHLNNGVIDDTQAEAFISNCDNRLVLISIDSCQVTDASNNIQQY